MMCHVAVLGQDTLITFWAIEGDGHQRRLMQDGRTGHVWLDTKHGTAITIGSSNKYFHVVAKLMTKRANSRRWRGRSSRPLRDRNVDTMENLTDDKLWEIIDSLRDVPVTEMSDYALESLHSASAELRRGGGL